MVSKLTHEQAACLAASVELNAKKSADMATWQCHKIILTQRMSYGALKAPGGARRGEGMHTMYTNDGGVICSAKSNYSNKQSRVHLGLSNIIENNI